MTASIPSQPTGACSTSLLVVQEENKAFEFLAQPLSTLPFLFASVWDAEVVPLAQTATIMLDSVNHLSS